jgi:carboxyl-terminal processing protease
VTSLNLRILAVVFLVSMFCYGNAVRLRKVGDLGLVMDLIEQQYVDEASQQDLYRSAMKGMINSLDPYSGYISQESLQPFQSMLEQEFGGLGVSLDGQPRRDRLTVVHVLYDSPAFRAGIKQGDIILEVDGIQTDKMTYSEVVKLLRGKEGTKVSLKLERKEVGEPLLIDVVRARIEVESVLGDRRQNDGRWDFHLQGDTRIGYFHIELFGEKTAAELEKAIVSLKEDCRGIILDLRDNTGGLLEAAIKICDMFLDEGEIVSTRTRGGIVDHIYRAQPGMLVPNPTPIVVLINDQSASASEILAACLQDRQRATIVGARSFGKGSVQNVIPLEGGRAAMRLTTAYYYPPNGRLIHRRKDAKPEDEWGVQPDAGCVVEVDEQELSKISERFIRRADPSQTAPVEESSTGLLAKDPSLAEDPQLLKAVEIVLSKISHERNDE